MKRRLFLKKGGLKITGVAVAPLLLAYGCDTIKFDKPSLPDTKSDIAKADTTLVTDEPAVEVPQLSPITQAYSQAAENFLTAAQGVASYPYSTSEYTALVTSAAVFSSAAQKIDTNIKTLNSLSLEALEPAATEVLQGAKILESIEGSISKYSNYRTGQGSIEMITGANHGLSGSIEVVDNPRFLDQGGQQIETGGYEVLQGAEEFVAGLR